MKNQPNTGKAVELQVCSVCKKTGQHGAKWNFFVGDSQVPQKVHKPCGEELQATAPKDVRTALIPSPELRNEWRKKRQAKDFWNNAFAEAKPIQKTVAGVVPVAG